MKQGRKLKIKKEFIFLPDRRQRMEGLHNKMTEKDACSARKIVQILCFIAE